MIPEHIQPILEWPRETWSLEEQRQVNEYRSQLHAEMVAIADWAERQDRDLESEEQERFDACKQLFDRLGGVTSVT